MSIDSYLEKKGWKIVAKCDKSVFYHNQNKSENNVYITVSTSTAVNQIENLVKLFKLMCKLILLAKTCDKSASNKGNLLKSNVSPRFFIAHFLWES